MEKTPSYEASTQFNSWRFSPQRLHALRGTLNAAAVAAIRSTFEADEVSRTPHHQAIAESSSPDRQPIYPFWTRTRSTSSSNCTSQRSPNYVATSASPRRSRLPRYPISNASISETLSWTGIPRTSCAWSLHPFLPSLTRIQADSAVSGDQNDEQSHLSRLVHLQHPSNIHF